MASHTDLIRAYQPGWVWRNDIHTGTLGESIVNKQVTMNLVDGRDLVTIIRKVVTYGWHTKDKLIQDLKNNGADYNWTEITKHL